MTATRLPAGFSGVDPPAVWPPTRGRPRPEALARPLDALPGVGASLRGKLAKLGLRTVRDLLEHRPFRYEPAAPVRRIADLVPDEEVIVVGEVLDISERRRGRLKILKAKIGDDSAQISATWFNQPWLLTQLVPGTRVRLRGKADRYGFAVRAHDLGDAMATADFAPVYPATEDVPQKRIRDLAGAALEHARDLADPLPAELKVREGLPLRADALHALHRPRTEQEAEEGRRRLALDELLVLQLGIARRVRDRERTLAPALGEPGELIARYRGALPFELTPDQESAIRELDADLTRTVPMQRLLQGDVGSGKTVVALYALLRAVEAGRQGALMAPTETLAEQHFLTVEELCRELGVTVVLLTSALPAKQHAAARAQIGSGEVQVAVGTHALIQREVEFADLAVAVVDEQHRFGVEQRSALTESRSPHVLHMTATPIPRTLALTVYGDLAVTEIAHPPASRKPIVTSWVTEERSSAAYRRLQGVLREGRQAYVVCPLIEESETSSARAAEQEADRLRRAELKDFRVGCLHGRLRPTDRRELMARFKARELDVLVATTVIEVGVDVPNATVMIVQEADRFGLAQLHQLRGRVGRGAEQSFCLLVSRAKDELTDSARERLEAMVRTTDGFELAEVDLEIRGGGQLLGTRQAGLSDLKFAKLRADRPLLERARAAARELIDVEGPLQDEVDARFADVALTA
ncbi:MAG: ATP-dependent helicase RecG [Gaiellaceae bacterium]|nr:ATP-dependent helicase RecG [Gaiellaceae bacterium]